ncbi:MAG: phosphomannomutase [Desulfuromonas sp.]|nr:phosphomannomutase [Desulfuromonas sp.]
MTAPLTCFKAYDIRGRVPDQLNENILYRIGRAYAQFLKPRQVVVGYDIRPDSANFAAALSRALNDAGTDVIDIGLCGTEEIYFHTFHRGSDGGIMVTASHNPMDYNGLKMVREGSRPISGDSGLLEIKALAESGMFADTDAAGTTRRDIDKSAYIEHLMGYIDRATLKPLKIVVNAGNGCAGPVIDALEPHLPFQFVKVHHEPDSRFPNGIPNPLLPENRAATADAVRRHGADLGLAWDGDFDRCFFFDQSGRFIEGYYLVGLLAEQLLQRHPGAKIIHDPRLTWNTVEQVGQAGGIPVQSKTGHAFIKERMRSENAVYGGEMSAHHYFRDFAYCDSGMIPWLLIADLICRTGSSMADLVDRRIAAYPCSGEINFEVHDLPAAIAKVLAHYQDQGGQLDRTDGVSLDFDDWRFNLRGSNTEPLLRLNVETRADAALLSARFQEIRGLLQGA